MHTPQLTIDGREDQRTPLPAPEWHETVRLFDFPTGIAGQTALDTDTPTREPMRPRAGVRHSGEWS